MEEGSEAMFRVNRLWSARVGCDCPAALVCP